MGDPDYHWFERDPHLLKNASKSRRWFKVGIAEGHPTIIVPLDDPTWEDMAREAGNDGRRHVGEWEGLRVLFHVTGTWRLPTAVGWVKEGYWKRCEAPEAPHHMVWVAVTTEGK
jgi:hypothetical protein